MEKAKEQLEELPQRLQADATFINAARNSNRETAMQQCAASLMMIVAGMLNENTEFCRYYLDNPDFMNAINLRVFDTVYSRLGSSPSVASDTPISYGYTPSSNVPMAAEKPPS